MRAALIAVSVMAGLALTAAPASAATCSVPGTYPTIQQAVNDVTCDPINVGPGPFADNLSITRNVTINGAGAGVTLLGGGVGTAIVAGSIGTDSTINISGFSILGTGPGVAVLGGDILNLSDSVISGHSASTGAGANVSGTLNGDRLTIANNSTTAGGGAGINNLGTVDLADSTISGNHALGAGGGFRNSVTTSVATLTNVTFFNNSSDIDGGNYASASSGSVANLNNVTMARGIADDDANNTGDGGDLYSQGGTTTLRNTIVADDTDETPLPANGQAHDCSIAAGTLSRAGYVLVENATATGTASACVYSGMDFATGYQTGVDPLLASALGSNGGPTQTLALNPGSPAINAGSPETPGSGGNSCPTTDQRGLPRGGGAGVCDLGAFEVQPVPPATVTPSPTATPTPPKKKKCKKKKKRKGAAAAKKCKKRKKR